ncbi:MAG: type II toxin-antitoxin system VapB family antitoxin [Deferribacteraceae bacterium]|jgi:Arc/MetJ family transcription regulator|nr:type II toxin-antitoxin system VapB family antitoxin [Deferribacteraceae bacterium]
MRTNIDIDDNLIKEAMAIADINTKKEVVELALTEFVQNRNRKDLKELFGKINFSEGYDYKEARVNR